MIRKEYISSRVKDGLKKSNSRALMKAAGLTDEEIRRPFIGVANSWTNIFPGHNHLDKLGQAVMDGIRISGGTPVAFETIAICDNYAMGNIGMKYSLPSREIIANSIESVAIAHACDGIVLVASCDKIVPGMLIGALRVNIPTIIITGGPMMAGKYKGKRIELRSGAEAMGLLEAGKITEEEFYAFEDENCPGCGSCKGMYTANSMCCMTEALGISLPGNGTVPAVHGKRIRMAKETGMQIMNLVKNDIKPSDIITHVSLENAVKCDMMLGCSTNTALHLPAIAGALGIDLNLDDFDRISRIIPQVCKLFPAGMHAMEDLDDAGGMPAVIKQGIDAGLIDGNTFTVTGKSLSENVISAEVYNSEVIRSLDNPYSKEGGIMVLKGSLAPLGSVVKSGGVAEELWDHIGPARVFEDEREVMQALLDNKINKGDIIILRYEGPKGGPGMQEMLAVTGYICGMGIDTDIILITDGRFSGGSRGAAIGHVSPEAALGGPIAYVENGDLIHVNLYNRALDLLVDSNIIEERKEKWIYPPPKINSGWLKQYTKLVGPVSHGAQLVVDD